MKSKILKAYTNFGLAGISSVIIAIGDLIWLAKDMFKLPYFVYFITFTFLLVGLFIAILSIVRHAEQHAKKVHHHRCKL